ncbi:DMT family transporter [Nocardia farcinica]|uniref:DMT family transporter n=1 Tax=Nocardia farcinica TaxID=37329 RepID=UPI002455248D|nr:DMT family transporter [Nocardia farcinica]
MRREPATLLPAAAVLVWGASYTVTGWGLRELDVLSYNAIRFAAAAPLLFAVVLLTEGAPWVARAVWPRLAVSASIGIVAYQLTFSLAVAWTTVTEAAILIALSPLWAALFAAVAGERVPGPVVVAALAATVGVILVVTGRPDGPPPVHRLAGDLAALAAGVLWGLYPVVTRPLLDRYSPVRVTAWAALIGGAVLLAGAALLPGARPGAAEWAALTWVSLAFSVLAVTVFGLVAWYRGVRALGSARTMLHMFAVPVVAAAFAVVGGERIGPAQILGGALVLAALAAVPTTRPDPAPPVTPASKHPVPRRIP